jgi:8-oxo-dGTP pyrophosphatase MutT (NUDIX family)
MKEISTVGTLLEHQGRILTLLRSDKEHSPRTWGLAAGRLEAGEEPLDTVLREIKEETGYCAHKDELIFLGIQEWEFPEFKVHFYTYKIMLKKKIKVTLDPEEHIDYAWKTPEEILALHNPIPGLKELITEIYF